MKKNALRRNFSFYLYIPLSIALFGFAVFDANAAIPFDFENYSPTLGGDSAYDLEFEEVLDPENDGYMFMTYKYNSETEVWDAVYYNYSYDTTKTSVGRISSGNGGLAVTGPWIEEGNPSSPLNGGAIFINSGHSIGDVTGDFISNVGFAGGAIYTYGSMGDITGDFIDNYGEFYGGAIQNSSVIENITGHFIGNHSIISGGAIINSGTINNLTGSFIANGGKNNGGAIDTRYGHIDNITGDFIANYVYGTYIPGGGAVYVWKNATIGKIDGNFYGNYVTEGYGGAMGVEGFIDRVEGNFVGNHAASMGGAIANYDPMRPTFMKLDASSVIAGINTIKSDFTDNYAKLGGAIYNGAKREIGSIEGKFTGNHVVDDVDWGEVIGGAIYNDYGKIGSISGGFYGNYAKGAGEYTYAYGGAINNVGTIGTISGDFIGNYVEASEEALGGAIYNNSYRYDEENDKELYPSLVFVNSNFIDNYAGSNSSTSGYGLGGAIFSHTDLNIVADGGTSVFSGNIADDYSNAIYMGRYDHWNEDTQDYEDAVGNLTLNAINNGVIWMYDDIEGEYGYKVNLIGDASGTINLYGNIFSADITVGEDVVVVNPLGRALRSSTIDGINVAHGDLINHYNSLYINSGTLNILNLGDTRLHFDKFESNGGILNVLNSEVDLAAQTMGGITADDYVQGSTVINVNKVTVNTDGVDSVTNVNFTDNIIGDQVASAITSSTGPVYDYGVEYDAASGDFIFTRGGNNPAVLLPGATAAASAGVLSDEIYTRMLADIDSVDDNVVCTRQVAKTFAKTFGSNDSVDLKNFVGADTEFYGLIGGIESGRINEGKGWSAVYNMYGAYVHGEQDYGYEEVKQKGGYVGVGGTLYKGNFFAGVTTNIGFLKNEAKTAAGKDKFDSWLGGIGFKTGYKYKYGNDITFQPNIYGSYTYVNVEDYRTKGGADIEFGAIHVFEIAPGLKLSKEFENELTGYITGKYVWTFTEGDDVKANDIKLPNVELESFVEYGLGAEKRWKDYDASAFAEVTRRDGGREGWNFLVGVKKAF